ncbi:MAG TPA: 5-formyltetrahydrofolate cyclo-ligase [Tepidisphaeraceae bacterium]|jgi:5-formyltetrahydrofolate cyclo-ligase
MDEANLTKSEIRKSLREILAGMSEADRKTRSSAACNLLAASPEFAAARVVMLYLSMPSELDTAALALKCWQQGKTVVVPKVSWDGKRMLPVEIHSLQTSMTTSGMGVREPAAGQPVPTEFIDLVIVPGLGFTAKGHRIGRGMGFYDRFLATPEFVGLTCGLAFEQQIVPQLPLQEHDVPLSMLVTDANIRRFACNCIQHS